MSITLFNSKYQNAHIDRSNLGSMKTVNITFTTNFASSATPVLIYSYAHGLDYTPQFWGLWDITYSASLGGATRRGYGSIPNNTGGSLLADFYYSVDSTTVYLYFLFNDLIAPDQTTSGTTATFTGYAFSNRTTAEDFTS